MHVYMYVLYCHYWGRGRVVVGRCTVGLVRPPPPWEIIGGRTAPPGPSPEIEVEKGRSESNGGKHFWKAVKKID